MRRPKPTFSAAGAAPSSFFSSLPAAAFFPSSFVAASAGSCSSGFAAGGARGAAFTTAGRLFSVAGPCTVLRSAPSVFHARNPISPAVIMPIPVVIMIVLPCICVFVCNVLSEACAGLPFVAASTRACVSPNVMAGVSARAAANRRSRLFRLSVIVLCRGINERFGAGI